MSGFGIRTGADFLLIFGLLQWLEIPSGSFLDWLIGAASFWWLVIIVTVPWNIHFEAKAVLADAETSRQKGIEVDEQQMRYVQTLSRRSLWIAIALHALSALGLYLLAATGISAIGYISSAAALLLTILRPAIALYQYLAQRLGSIRHGLKYPREDVVSLGQQVSELETFTRQLRYQLNLDQPEAHPDSWASAQQQQITALRKELTQLAASHETLTATNQSEHSRLRQEARSAIAQLSSDSQFLEHVREIIQFFKAA
ncbi:MAG: hypothetical protein HC886_21890 [Leptolyngbyaceae cyanobacterium SM1_1_3]|nr:hypothetical protein [Leptolyngbyaceae cyanobacterium SM1_1_3]NJN01505.1 hypothetical protein [Leptolyngbyaceae cyanobacterium RM1_1_2]